jgi:hypothetical protein
MPIADSLKRIDHGHECAEDEIVNALDDSPDVRYAVIGVRQTETGPERIVIAYSSEESLRDLIAAPSIVAFGFASHDEAVMRGGASFPNRVVDEQTPETMAGVDTNRSPQRLDQQRRGETCPFGRAAQ